LGQDQIGSKSTCRPWNSACCQVQITRMAWTRSSMTGQRVGWSMSWLAISLADPADADADQQASA